MNVIVSLSVRNVHTLLNNDYNPCDADGAMQSLPHLPRKPGWLNGRSESHSLSLSLGVVPGSQGWSLPFFTWLMTQARTCPHKPGWLNGRVQFL